MQGGAGNGSGRASVHDTNLRSVGEQNRCQVGPTILFECPAQLICPLRIAASACSAIDELLAVEFQYSLRLIEPPLIRTRVWRHSNAVGPTSSKSSICAAWRAFGRVSRYPSRNKAYLQGRSRWPRSRTIRGNP